VRSEQHNNVVTCLTLGLTLLGNMVNSGLYELSDLQEYQHRIQNALRPLAQQNHYLRVFCGAFEQCTNSKAVFVVVQRLNQHYYNGEKRIYLQIMNSRLDLIRILSLTSSSVPQKTLKPCKPTMTKEGTSNEHSALESPDSVEQSELERQTSNEEDFDEDVKRALVFTDQREAEIVERQASFDQTIVDEKYCKACKTSLTSVNRDASSAHLKEHISTEEHKSREKQYLSYAKKEEECSAQICSWEKYTHQWKNQMMGVESLIFEVQEFNRKYENIVRDTDVSGKWRDGEERLLSLQKDGDVISRQLEDVKVSPEAEQQPPPEPALGDIDQSNEEVLSEIEDEITPREAKKRIRKKKAAKYEVT
jgi:hypothetical protein